jgi:hypothetical protein
VRHIAEFVAVLACSSFTGAAVYLGLVEHPARMVCGVEIAATEFPLSYRRATVIQASLAAVGPLSSIAAWLAGASFLWVVAGVLLGSVILPTNKRGALRSGGWHEMQNRSRSSSISGQQKMLGHAKCARAFS